MPLSEALHSLDGWVEERSSELNLVSLAMTVVHHRDVVWTKAIGYQDLSTKAPASVETLYRLASATKPFTATAIMQLWEQGRLRLDDPVTRYLPWFTMRGYTQNDPVTIEHLLSHSSGLPKEAPFPYYTTFAYPSVDQLMAALPEQSVVFEPGLAYKYSNLGYALLGLIVSAISGQTFPEYVHKQIFEPLGMKDTCLNPGPAHQGRIATGYSARREDGDRRAWPQVDTKAMGPAGGLWSTASDLAKFLVMHLDEGLGPTSQILGRRAIQRMRRVHSWMEDWKVGYSLGFYVRPHRFGELLSHGGDLPGFRAQPTMLPRRKLACIALSNSDDMPTLWEFTSRALESTARAVPSAAEGEVTRSPFRPEWRQYLGKYRDVLDEWSIVKRKGRLALADRHGSALTTLTPVRGHVFRMDEGEYIGEHVVFETEPRGRVIRVKYAEHYFEPV